MRTSLNDEKGRITAIRKVMRLWLIKLRSQYDDLMAKYENRRTKQEQRQARLSYDDGFRPVSFYIETIE